MKNTFTKKDLLTGDIIEQRNGELGVVIREKEFILYQAGGLDELDIFTEDLFVDGADRTGDIFKVYRDNDGPIGFIKRFDAITVFSRKNNKETKSRAQELSDKYDPIKGKICAIFLEPNFRRCYRVYVDPHTRYEVRNGKDVRTGQTISDIDIALSEAPSMTACGQIGIDRTLIPVPGTDSVCFMYNQCQEKRYLQLGEESNHRDKTPVVEISEKGISIYSRCLIVKRSPDGEIEDITTEDYEITKKYLNQMQKLSLEEPAIQW